MVVLEVKLSVCEFDYARTTCIIRILGVNFLGVIKWIQDDILLLLPLTVKVNKNVKERIGWSKTF